MTDKKTRILEVDMGEVQCLPDKKVSIEKCRFCVHSKKIRESGIWKVSPARAYCVLSKNNDRVDMEKAEAVECGDLKREGYRSILNVIS